MLRGVKYIALSAIIVTLTQPVFAQRTSGERTPVRTTTQTSTTDKLFIGPIAGTEEEKSPELIALENVIGMTLQIAEFDNPASGYPISLGYVTSIDPQSRIAERGVEVGDFITFIQHGTDSGSYAKPVRGNYAFERLTDYPFFHLTFSKTGDRYGGIVVEHLSTRDRALNLVSAEATYALTARANAPFKDPSLTILVRSYPEVYRDDSTCNSDLIVYHVVVRNEADLSNEREMVYPLSQIQAHCNGVHRDGWTATYYTPDGMVVGRSEMRDGYEVPVGTVLSSGNVDFSSFNHDTLMWLLVTDQAATVRTALHKDWTPYYYYYYFAGSYGEECLTASDPRTQISLKTFETEQYFGGSNTELVDEDIFVVETRFADNVVSYGRAYVRGLSTYAARDDIDRLFRRFDCQSSVVQSVRASLFELGNAE